MARPRGRSRATRLTKRWVGFSTGASGLGLSAGSVGQVVVAASGFLDTILRTRGQLIAWLDGVQGPAPFIDVGVGLIIMSEGAAAGATFPAPLTDENADWFFYSRFSIGYEEMVVDVVDVPQISAYREMIDSKAMRKGPPDTEIVAVIEQATIQGSATVNVQLAGRFLLGQ